jgi:mono/diheme cytochrome c family protein
MRKKIALCSLILFVFASSAFIDYFNGDKPIPIPPSKQRTGDPKKGLDYLITGDYVRSGIPYKAFLFGAGNSKINYLKREGLNKNLPYQYTAIKAFNGEVLVAPNCLQCHAQVFNGQLVMGLGNSMIDFTKGKKVNTANIELLELMLKLNSGSQYEAAAPFIKVTKAVAPYLHTNSPGVNPADRLASILAAHRDPETFQWKDKTQLTIPDNVIPTDTPPWWLLKKKNGMFYNGFGRGDFGRFLMASNLLTVSDTSESRMVDEHMPDLLAYIYTLEPPKYPGKIDEPLAQKGKVLFEQHCSSCHGTYGDKEFYPNLLIPESMIQTDSFLYKSNYSNPQFINWFNNSWFTKGDHPAHLQPFEGYIAPPLDGIWLTAPYLHNGSVPTLEALLNSKLRPKYWSRNFNQQEYDYENVGWKFTIEDKPNKRDTYNTTLPGYGNYGHYFGDVLTDEERKEIIEYLKKI